MVYLTLAYACVAFLYFQLSAAFYLPGIAPTDYDPDQAVQLYVNAITPGNNPGYSSSLVSYDYYSGLLNFCQPKDGVKSHKESLGSILFGDRIYNGPIEMNMLMDSECKQICETHNNMMNNMFLVGLVKAGYVYNWIVDGLPTTFEMGLINDNGDVLLYNHFEINLDYHKTIHGKYRVVGVHIKPSSRTGCGNENRFHLIPDNKADIKYTYEVKWKESSVTWATRWDTYLKVEDPSIHWFSLVNSAIVAAFLSGLVASMLLRGVRKDISKYNDMEEDGGGWKLIYADVFRPPSHRMLLSVLIGSGTQLGVMIGITLTFALLGLLSPSNRGSLFSVVLILYVVLSSIGGYISARFYKTFKGENIKTNMILTALLVPGILFTGFFLLNFFLIYSKASGAVPFGTMVVMVLIWFTVSLPLCYAGSTIGFKKPAFEFPVKTNLIPREIPSQPKYLNPLLSLFLVGILPFGSIFIELYYISNSLWNHQFYYMFGFLFLYFVLMVLTLASVTVLFTYLLLKNENHNWAWRTFFAGGAISVYVFLYSLIYLFKSLNFSDITSLVLYLGYSSLLSFLVFVGTGTLGFLCSFGFVKKIYSAVKFD